MSSLSFFIVRVLAGSDDVSELNVVVGGKHNVGYDAEKSSNK